MTTGCPSVPPQAFSRGELVQRVDEAPQLLRVAHVAGEEHHAADAALRDELRQVGRRLRPLEAGEEQLPRIPGLRHGRSLAQPEMHHGGQQVRYPA